MFSKATYRCCCLTMILMLLVSCGFEATPVPTEEPAPTDVPKETTETWPTEAPVEELAFEVLVREAEGTPLFSPEDGITYLQSRLVGFLPTFYGRLSPERGYQVYGGSYQEPEIEISGDGGRLKLETDLEFSAINQGSDVVLAGPAYFIWQQVNDQTWEIEAHPRLFVSGAAFYDQIEMKDEVKVQQVDDSVYEITQETIVSYTVELQPFCHHSQVTSRLEQRDAGLIVVDTSQEARVFRGDRPEPFYTERNSIYLEKTIHNETETDYHWKIIADNNRGLDQSNEIMGQVMVGEGSAQVDINYLEGISESQRLYVEDLTQAWLEETGEGHYQIWWELPLRTDKQVWPVITAQAEFDVSDFGEGKTEIRESLTVGVPDEGFERKFYFWVDPVSTEDWLIAKALAAPLGVLAGPGASAITFWWLGIKPNLRVADAAMLSGLALDFGAGIRTAVDWVEKMPYRALVTDYLSAIARNQTLALQRAPHELAILWVDQPLKMAEVLGEEKERLEFEQHRALGAGNNAVETLQLQLTYLDYMMDWVAAQQESVRAINRSLYKASGQAKLEDLIQKLGSEDWQTRATAQNDLQTFMTSKVEYRAAIYEELLRVIKTTDDAEVKMRCQIAIRSTLHRGAVPLTVNSSLGLLVTAKMLQEDLEALQRDGLAQRRASFGRAVVSKELDRLYERAHSLRQRFDDCPLLSKSAANSTCQKELEDLEDKISAGDIDGALELLKGIELEISLRFESGGAHGRFD